MIWAFREDMLLISSRCFETAVRQPWLLVVTVIPGGYKDSNEMW